MIELITERFLDAWGELQVKLAVGKLVTSNRSTSLCKCSSLTDEETVSFSMKRELLQRTNGWCWTIFLSLMNVGVSASVFMAHFLSVYAQSRTLKNCSFYWRKIEHLWITVTFSRTHLLSKMNWLFLKKIYVSIYEVITYFQCYAGVWQKLCAVNYLNYSLCQIRSLPMLLLIHDWMLIWHLDFTAFVFN